MAPRLVKRLCVLPTSTLASIMSSDEAFSRALDWAMTQEASSEEVGTARSRRPSANATGHTPPYRRSTTPSGHTPTQRSVSPLIARCVQGQTPCRILKQDDQPYNNPSPAVQLTNRVAQLEPELAFRIVDKILDLGPAMVHECLDSDLTLHQVVEAAAIGIRREDPAKETPTQMRASSRTPSRPRVNVSRQVVGDCSPQAYSPAPHLASSATRSLSPDLRGHRGGNPQSSPPQQPCRLVRLEDFLEELALSRYLAGAVDWAERMGAVSLEELLENEEEFAEAMGLKPLEKSRLQRRGAEVAGRLLQASRDAATPNVGLPTGMRTGRLC